MDRRRQFPKISETLQVTTQDCCAQLSCFDLRVCQTLNSRHPPRLLQFRVCPTVIPISQFCRMDRSVFCQQLHSVDVQGCQALDFPSCSNIPLDIGIDQSLGSQTVFAPHLPQLSRLPNAGGASADGDICLFSEFQTFISLSATKFYNSHDTFVSLISFLYEISLLFLI